ncbi:hypothetical protein MMC29_001517 [Sticta canariensis]|nr:hypothetical protein [Sticta canariensis]
MSHNAECRSLCRCKAGVQGGVWAHAGEDAVAGAVLGAQAVPEDALPAAALALPAPHVAHLPHPQCAPAWLWFFLHKAAAQRTSSSLKCSIQWGGQFIHVMGSYGHASTHQHSGWIPSLQHLLGVGGMQLMSAHMSRVMLLAIEVAVEFWLSLQWSPQAQWLRDADTPSGSLRDEVHPPAHAPAHTHA